MGASITAQNGSVTSQRTIPPTSSVGNGRLQNRWTGERPAEPQEECQQKNELAAVDPAVERAQPPQRNVLDNLFDPAEIFSENENRRLGSVPKNAVPYAAKKLKQHKVDVLA